MDKNPYESPKGIDEDRYLFSENEKWYLYFCLLIILYLAFLPIFQIYWLLDDLKSHKTTFSCFCDFFSTMFMWVWLVGSGILFVFLFL